MLISAHSNNTEDQQEAMKKKKFRKITQRFFGISAMLPVHS